MLSVPSSGLTIAAGQKISGILINCPQCKSVILFERLSMDMYRSGLT